MTHPPQWCGLLWVPCRRWGCVLGLAASRPCLLSCPGCSRTLRSQSCTGPGGNLQAHTHTQRPHSSQTAVERPRTINHPKAAYLAPCLQPLPLLKLMPCWTFRMVKTRWSAASQYGCIRYLLIVGILEKERPLLFVTFQRSRLHTDAGW